MMLSYWKFISNFVRVISSTDKTKLYEKDSTFDVYPSAQSSLKGKSFSATFVTDSEKTFTFTMVRPDGYKGTFKLTTVKPRGSGGDSGNPIQNAKDKVNEKVKGVLDKGLDAIKNKSKKDKKDE